MSSAFLVSTNSRQSWASLLESICCGKIAAPRSKIKLIVADRFGHRRRHERVNRQSRLHSRANLRRRNTEWKTREHPSAKRRWKRHGRLARTRNGDEFREPREFGCLAPFR